MEGCISEFLLKMLVYGTPFADNYIWSTVIQETLASALFAVVRGSPHTIHPVCPYVHHEEASPRTSRNRDETKRFIGRKVNLQNS